MELRGPNDHLTNMAEESLVRLFRSALERTGGDRDLTKIGHAINVILSEIESCNKVKVLGVDQQCIVIKMRCNNCQGLLELLEYLEGSRFKRRLHELVAALEITYKARFRLSSQIALGDLKYLLWNLRHLDEDKHGSKDDVINAERIQKEQHEAIYTEGKPTRIKVCGLPSDVTTDFLTLFFENKRKGGGVPVRKVSFYNDISTAVIEFESPEGVETVLSRRNIEMMGHAVTVVLYQPELARTVEVRGPTQIVCEGNIELLKSHFSNVGAVMKILYDRGRNSVLVTFETEEVAKKMLMRTHVINGKLLEVSLYTCSVREIYFRDKILLKGISSSTSEDNISHFLEATTGIKPMRIAYHKSNDDTALIEMESMPDITELKEVCKVHTVDGVHLDVCSVAISNCILVENVPNHFISELLEQYFENKVRSGGDLVEKIIKIEGLSALVYFKDKIGDQPPGTMTTTVLCSDCAGYKNCGTIEIKYRFPDGHQEGEHPCPGRKYEGTLRTAYLPNNAEGRKIAKLLRVAFDRRLVFTIGTSLTTGLDGVIIWNGIAHKTGLTPNSEFGYADPEYLDVVKTQLAAKGITEKDIDNNHF